MTRSTLFVPMHVDGLYLKAGARATGPSADFTRLPHLARDSDGEIFDANASHPWLTETVSDPPFSDETRDLEAGVHIHWALPDMLTRARHPQDHQGRKDRSQVVFPSVPNRWFVQRRAAGVVQASWVIESDYIWPVDYPWGKIDRRDFETAFDKDGPVIWKQLLASGWVRSDGATDIVTRKADRTSKALGPYAAHRADIEKALVKLSAAPNALREKLSSYLYPNESSDGFTDPGDPPFRLLGRVRGLGDGWNSTDNTPIHMPKTALGNLTAVGWGEPSFAAFYPNCRSIFGFHDDIHAEVHAYSYDVYGWFSDGTQDLLNDLPADAKDAETILREKLQWAARGPSQAVPDRMVCFGQVSASRFIPQAPGDLHGKPAPRTLDDSLPGMTVAVANTGTEALSAVLASELALARHGGRTTERAAEKRKIENYLEALHASDDLNHRLLDVGAKFLETRRDNTFVSMPGGRIWTLQADTDAPRTADATEVPGKNTHILPHTLSAQLSALNQCQRHYEHAQRSIVTIRRQVLADWQRYMRFAYPHDDQALDLKASRDEHDLDAAIGFLRHGSIAYLRELETDTGLVHVATDDPGKPNEPHVTLAKGSSAKSLGAELVRRVHDLRDALARESRIVQSDRPVAAWKLQTAPAPRFYQPKDPVVLLANGHVKPSDRNGHVKPSDRNGHDHGIDGTDALTCFRLDCAPPSGDGDDLDDSLRTLANKAHGLLDKITRDPTARIGVRKAARRLGHPFMLEWEAAIAPISSGQTAGNTNQRYDPDFIRKHWRLDDSDRILKERHTVATLPQAQRTVRGRGYLTPHSDRLLFRRIDAYVAGRMEEYYDAEAIAPAEQGAEYLQQNYPAVRSWMVAKGVDRLARDAGRDLLRMQAAAPGNSAFGIALDGTIGEMIRLAANAVPASKLVALAGLTEVEAQTIALHRSGADWIQQTFFAAKPDSPKTPDLKERLFTALEVDADLRPPLADQFRWFLAYLTGEASPTDIETNTDVPGTWIDHRPPVVTGFAGLVEVLRTNAPREMDPDGALGAAETGNRFQSFSALTDLAIFQRERRATGAAIVAKLLRFAHSNRYFGALSRDLQYLQECPPVMGLPAGGPVEREILRYVSDRIGDGDTRLTDEAGLPDNVVLELRLNQPIQSLAALKNVRMVDAAIFARIFHAADRDHTYIRKSDGLNQGGDLRGTEGSALFASRASAGHAWSDPILTAMDAWMILKSGFTSVAQNLSGFNDAMLMQRRRWQLPVSDPLGFLDYRAFTEKTVRNIVGEPQYDVISNGAFAPIRSGGMSLHRVRLIDTFGQITDIQAPHVITANGMEGEHSHQVMLPPRITQPSRLNFRWLDALGGEVEWNQHPETTPVCGWVVLNNFEGLLMIHAESGAPLGALDQLGAWHPPPGATGGVTSPDSIANTGLRRLVKWMMREAERKDSASDPFVVSFISLCETGLENIDPETFKNSEATALLMGRPMAVVRAEVSLECREPFAIDQGMAAFGKEIQGAPRNTHGFEDVLFPVRIGEHMQLNDGVVGVWPEAGDAFDIADYEMCGTAELVSSGIDADTAAALATLHQRRFATAWALDAALEPLVPDPATRERVTALCARRKCLAPQSDWVRNADLVTARAGRDDLNLWLPITSPPRPKRITILMDPRGSLHASCSALPTKYLEIPPSDYVRPMNRINISLMAAPVLTARSEVNLPLASESGWSWSWISKKGTKWSRLPAIPELRKAAFARTFGETDANKIWTILLDKGWLAPVDGSAERATVLPNPADATPASDRLRNGRPKFDLGAVFAPRAETILRVIELNARAIGSVSMHARFAQQEIIEGWMLLSPKDKPIYAASLHPEDDLTRHSPDAPHETRGTDHA